MSSLSRPNIVFITTDTQGREMVSPYGDRPGVDTPEIARIASEGVVFDNAFTTCPLCTPARGSWYSGVHPNRHGALANELAVSRAVPLAAEILKQSGYEAHHIGKWHLDAAGYDGAGDADGGFSPDSWYDLSCFYDEVGREGPNKFGGWNRGLEDPEYCFGHRVADRAIDYISSAAGRAAPFFLAVEFDEPHGPYICPPPFRDRFSSSDIYVPPTVGADLAAKPKLQQQYAAYLQNELGHPETVAGYYGKYYSCNSYVDYEIGRVFRAIQEHMPENTVVIYTSDHGDHLGAFGLGPKGPTMYDHTIAVPLIIWSSSLTEPRHVSSLVSSVDVWRTVMDLAGAPVELRESDGYDCYSLMPLVNGSAESVREAAFIEYNRFGIQFDQCDGFYPIRCVRTADHKLVINLFDSDELYDLRSDPAEANNLIQDGSIAGVRDELHERLLEWQHRTQDLLRSPRWRDRSWAPTRPAQFTGFTTTGFHETWDDWEWNR